MTYTMCGMELRLKLSKVKFKMNLGKHMVYLFSNIPMLWTHCNWMLVLSQGASSFDVSVSVLLKLQICLKIDWLTSQVAASCLSEKWQVSVCTSWLSKRSICSEFDQKTECEQSTCFAQVGDPRPQAEWSCNLLRGRRTTSRRYQPQPHHEHHLDHLDLGGMVSRAELPGSNAFPAAFVSHHNNHAGKRHSKLFYNNHHHHNNYHRSPPYPGETSPADSVDDREERRHLELHRLRQNRQRPKN